LSTKEKEKKKDKKKKRHKDILIVKNCKTKCCDKFLKGEKKRCDRCPKFDLLN
jgi:hypothetical protein